MRKNIKIKYGVCFVIIIFKKLLSAKNKNEIANACLI